jgi:transketolase
VSVFIFHVIKHIFYINSFDYLFLYLQTKINEDIYVVMKNRKRIKRKLLLQVEKIRKRVIEIIHAANGGHAGGSLSSIEIETVLYFYVMNIEPNNPQKADRDRFILSKGHSVETLYAVLEAKGFISKEDLDTYGKYKSPLAGHPTKETPGVELNSGSLGHGLSVGVGLSIANKMDANPSKTFVLMGDGEQGEGSIYEAAMAASHYELDNLIAIIDRNYLQISGNTEDVMSLDPMRYRWKSFGWDVFEVNGNDVEELMNTFDSMPFNNRKPKLVIARTTKGNGISYMENIAQWHHGVPNEEQYKQAIREIDERIIQYSSTR